MLEEPCIEENEEKNGDEDEINLGEMIQDPSQKAEPFFLMGGKTVYKSTCLKTISSNKNLSKDRLRRVQGMTYYPGESTVTSSHDDSLLFIGDPLLV